MSEVTGTFHCPACAARFTWKPQYAGRKMRCKCGKVFAPAEPQPAAAAAGAAPDFDSYDFTEDTAAPAATRAPVHAAATAPAPAAPAPESLAALYGRKSRFAPAEESEPEEGSNLKNIYIPLVLLALGLGLRITQLVYANANRANKWAATGDVAPNPGRAVLLSLCEMVIATAIMMGGAFLSAMLLNINFGPVGKAALKLGAIAVFATGLAAWVAVFDQDRHSVTGLAVALHIVVIIYWIAMAYFFSLELQETLLTVAIISVVQAMGMCVLWRA